MSVQNKMSCVDPSRNMTKAFKYFVIIGDETEFFHISICMLNAKQLNITKRIYIKGSQFKGMKYGMIDSKVVLGQKEDRQMTVILEQ